MEEITKINKLNKQILGNSKKIRNLRIRDDIIGFIPMITLTGTLTAIYLNNSDNFIIKEFYPISFYLSIVIGGIPSAYLPTQRTKNKILKYQLEIKDALDELYGFAIEEDKKRMIMKK